MDLGTALTGGVLIIIILLPFIGMRLKKNRKKKKLYEELAGLAKEENCTITTVEIVDGIALGLDESANKLFFVREQTEQLLKMAVDLNAVVRAEVLKIQRTIAQGTATTIMVDKLAMRLHYAPAVNGLVDLPFYNAEEDMQLSGELQFMQKWTEKVGEIIRIK